jgi:hypothetical protein
MKRSLIVMLLTLGVVVGTLGPAAVAGKKAPVLHERYGFEFEPEYDEFLSDICGIDVYVEGSGKGTLKLYEDGRIVDHYNATEVYFSPDTGERLIRQAAATYRGYSSEEFDEETMIATITYDDFYVGLPSKWFKPGEGVLLRDAGTLRALGTAVVDFSNPDEPVLISLDEEVMVKGPHPEWFLDFDEFVALGCEALGA